MKYKELYQIVNDIVDEVGALDRFTDEFDFDEDKTVSVGVIDDIGGFLDPISDLIQRFRNQV